MLVPRMAPGSAPHDPAVGAATTTPMELLTSIMAEVWRITWFRTSPSSSVPAFRWR